MIWCVHEATRRAEASGVQEKDAKVFDATGAEILGIVWMDTETGEVERLQFAPDGTIVCNYAGRANLGPVTVRGFHPAPLSVVEIEEPAS